MKIEKECNEKQSLKNSHELVKLRIEKTPVYYLLIH